MHSPYYSICFPFTFSVVAIFVSVFPDMPGAFTELSDATRRSAATVVADLRCR